MSRALALLVCLLGAVSLRAEAMPDLTEGGWVLCAEWWGYMYTAVQFHEDERVSYWFSSDVETGDEPDYPTGGFYDQTGRTIRIFTTGNIVSIGWNLRRWRGHWALVPEPQLQRMIDREPVDDSRFLYHIPDFDPAEPYAQQVSIRALAAEPKL